VESFDRQEKQIDPISMEVVRNKLDGISNEMQLTLVRTAYSPVVKEGLDASASLFTIEGETLSQAIAIPIHLATLIPIVKRVLKDNPIHEMKVGDIFIMNDPYLGGTHLPDIALIKPVFINGRPIAFSACMTHHQDVGGMSPGSVPTNATEIFQEGIRIPPLKLVEAGQINVTLTKMLKQNVRIPDNFFGDLNAQIAACNVGELRLQKLATQVGDNSLLAIFDGLLDLSEKLTRNALLSLPEGEYFNEDFLDNDGVVLDKKVKISVRVLISDGKMHCDFTGTDQSVKGPFNCVPSGTQAAAYFALRAITGANIPTNGGCFRTVTLELPEGSLLNPRAPAPVNSRTATIKRVSGCILGALRAAAPHKIGADGACSQHVLVLAGNDKNGAPYVVGEMIASGSGAGVSSDGVDVIETDTTNCMNLPAEALEMDAPIRLNRFSLRPDSGGLGTYRGGLGVIREYEVLSGEVQLTHRGERHMTAARGAAKGSDGAKAISRVLRSNGSEEIILSKQMMTLGPGDRLIVETAGGGGYGSPSGRSEELSKSDFDNGKTTYS